MTLFILSFAAVQLFGLFTVLMAVRHAPVAVEDSTGFHVIRHPASAAVAVAIARTA